MYAEYALDPELLDNWKDFRFYAESFGWDTGRLVAQYPKGWKKSVYDVISAADIQPVKKASMRDRLNRLDCLIRRHGMTWEESRTWLDNALEECAREPFHCIISRNRAPDQPKLLCDDDLLGAGTLWDPPDDVVPRVAAEIASALSLLLRSAKRVVLVDPYFNPARAEITRSLQEILQQVARNERPSGDPVKIYVSMDRYFPGGEERTEEEVQRILRNFEHSCQENMPRLIPAGMTVEVTMLARRGNGERLHNRYVMTERSGVCFGAGLAETDGADSSTDDLGRMSVAKHDLRWAQYAGERGAFDVVGSSIVVAAGR